MSGFDYIEDLDPLTVECARPGCKEVMPSHLASWNESYQLPYCDDEERDMDADRVHRNNALLQPWIVHRLDDEMNPYADDIGLSGYKPWRGR